MIMDYLKLKSMPLLLQNGIYLIIIILMLHAKMKY